MYIPASFEEHDGDQLRAWIAEHPLATLVTVDSGVLNANHLPLLLVETSSGLCLQGHVARANPMWRGFDASVGALAIFQVADAYITPTWYAEKALTHRVVPTWNYVAVHVAGKLRVIEDHAWLLNFVERLTNRMEAGREEPWQVSDAPADYIEKMLGAIVGIELAIEKIEGKRKAGQNRSVADRAGMVEGLLASGDQVSHAMARLTPTET